MTCFNQQLVERDVLLLEPGISVSRIRDGLQPRVYFIFFFRKSSENFHRASEYFLQIATDVQEENIQREDDSPDKQYCIAVDLQLCPTELSKEEIPKENTICFYLHDRYTVLDMMTEQERDRKLNLIRITYPPKPLSKPSLQRAIVVLPCPLSMIKRCPSSDVKWLCDKCRATIEYSFEYEEIYCDCGSFTISSLTFPIPSFTFRCNSELHGINFVPNEQLQEHLKALPLVKSINILVLGETGVGKSTWINSVANYMTYSTFNQAKAAEELLYLIPAKFDIDDENGENHVIEVGTPDEAREVFSIGQSSTQTATSYVFPCGDHNVRFIDTPGIGDARGVEQDTANFSMILAYLANVEYLHGICILLKPDINRLSLQFRFCITELLKHLHISAADNIVFCFTNAGSKQYKYGTAKKLLELVIRECTEERVNIKMEENTMFTLENESFLYLAAHRKGVIFSDEDIERCSKGWEISKRECERLFGRLQTYTPHQLKSTICLNTARNTINAMIKPMAIISENLKLNSDQWQKEKEKILKEIGTEINRGDGNNVIKARQIKLSLKQLRIPSIVCNDSSCSDMATDSETKATNMTYKAICKEKSNAFVQIFLNIWWKFSTKCEACGHHRSLHDVITYETVQEVYFKEVADLSELNRTMDNQENVRTRVSEIICKFAKFLRVNALVTNEDVYVDYIHRELNLVEGRPTKSYTEKVIRQQKVELLLTLEKDYKTVKASINEQAEDGNCISAEQVFELRDELYAIPEIAEYLKDTMSAITMAYADWQKRNEIIFDVRSKRKNIYDPIRTGKAMALRKVNALASKIAKTWLGEYT